MISRLAARSFMLDAASPAPNVCANLLRVTTITPFSSYRDWTGPLLGNGLGVTSASFRPKAHSIAPAYIF